MHNLDHLARNDGALERLQQQLQAGYARALAEDEPALVSRTLVLDRHAPDPNPAAFGRYALWQQAEQGFGLVAIGRAGELTATGPARFGCIRSSLDLAVATALVEREDDVPLDLPFAVAGFTFDTQGEEGQKWPGHPDALAVIPRLLFTRIGNDRYLTLNVIVEPASDVGGLADALARDVELAFTPAANTASELPLLRATSPDGYEAWHDNMRSLTGLIERGEAEKVVLARRFEVESKAPLDVTATLERLRARYPGCTVFAWRDGDTCFLGATPEMLVRLRDGIVSADCLAGSIRRGATEEEDIALGLTLQADDKERREHAMVVRGLVDSLADVCHDIDVPDTPALKRMANVQHLHTPLRATMPGRGHVLELVERLHPTPAVGGLPRERAVCLIRQHEDFDRGWYAGPIGWIDANGGGEFAVALRSALVEGNRASLYAGCGIVRGSDPAREYDESKLKLSAVLSALGTVADETYTTTGRPAEKPPRAASGKVRATG